MSRRRGRKREEAENRALVTALSTSSALGAFVAALGVLGWDGAVELCDTREVPPEVLAVWEPLGYREAHLPLAEDMRLIRVAVEVKRRMYVARTNDRALPTKEAMEGFDPHDVARGLVRLDQFGCRVEARSELRGI